MKFDEKPIAEVLLECGYQRVSHRTYRAMWGTSFIEHFIYLDLWGTPKTFLAVRFGLRCQEAEAFALDEILRLGGPTYQLMDKHRIGRCFMAFSLGRLAAWKPSESLSLPTLSESELKAALRSALRDHLQPVIGEITTPRKFYEFLAQDEETHRWVRTNAAIRAAIMVKLAAMLGERVSDVRAVVVPHIGPISGQLQGISAHDFLAILLHDAGLSGPISPDNVS